MAEPMSELESPSSRQNQQEVDFSGGVHPNGHDQQIREGSGINSQGNGAGFYKGPPFPHS